MKQTKAIVLTAMLTLLAFGAIVYTSCRKDRCKKLNCQNGGTCLDGYCICPTGYTGTYCQIANLSNIAFRNETFTTVTLTVNGSEYSVDSGKTLTFTGSHGDTLKGSGKTHGLYGINVSIVSFKIVFPARGTIVHDVDVSPDYFFLMVVNNIPSVPHITKVYVNYKQRDSTLDVIEQPTHQGIANTGATYHIGYFKAYPDTKVRLETTPNFWTDSSFLPQPPAVMTKNQFYKAIAP